MLPAEYILHCRQLLLEHERAWIDYQRRLADYDLKQLELTQTSPQTTPYGPQTTPSPYIEWNGAKYDCHRNTCTGNCLWDASKAHQKCKCRALYMPGQGHLHAPCQDKGVSGPHLTFEVCKKLGYLEPELTQQLGQALPGQVNQNKPQPIYPVITCDHCRQEFEALQHNFTNYNYQQAQACIDQLERQGQGTDQLDPRQDPSRTNRTILDSLKWVGLGLGLLLLVMLVIGYWVWRSNKRAKQCGLSQMPTEPSLGPQCRIVCDG